MSAEHTAHVHVHTHPSPKVYAQTAAALVVLMCLTIAAYKVDVGHMVTRGDHDMGVIVNNLIAVVIAVFKAYLVVRNFMGVKWASAMVKVWAAMGFVSLPMVAMFFGDFSTRHWEEGKAWDSNPRQISNIRSEIDPAYKAMIDRHAHSAHSEEAGAEPAPAGGH